MLQIFAYGLIAGAAGLSFVMQQAVNSELRASLGAASWAGFASYLGGTVCMLVLALILRDPVPTLAAMRNTTAMQWTGGVFGAIYIGISIFLVPRLGAASFIALLVAGQMAGSLAFDHFGAFGLPQHTATPTRALGAALLIVAVLLIRA